MGKQSDLGKELNRIMLETEMTPLQTISAVMESGLLNIGNHKFVPKLSSPKKEEG